MLRQRIASSLGRSEGAAFGATCALIAISTIFITSALYS
jgi:hypothetical protein